MFNTHMLSTRHLLYTLLCFMLPLCTEAQIGFRGGILAGATTSQVAGDSYAGFNKIGLSAGPFVRMVFGSEGSMKMSMLYSQKGSRNKPDTEAGDFSYFKLKLNYIEVPVSYEYTRNNLRFEGGLYFAYLMTQKEDFGPGEGDPVPAYNDYDFGGQIGLTYQIVPESVFTSITVSNSLTSIRKAPPSQTRIIGYDGQGYNHAINIHLGFQF